MAQKSIFKMVTEIKEDTETMKEKLFFLFFKEPNRPVRVKKYSHLEGKFMRRSSSGLDTDDKKCWQMKGLPAIIQNSAQGDGEMECIDICAFKRNAGWNENYQRQRQKEKGGMKIEGKKEKKNVSQYNSSQEKGKQKLW